MRFISETNRHGGLHESLSAIKRKITRTTLNQIRKESHYKN